MEKKYQIFISSTYKDLIEARSKVRDAILSMMHFPVGMEMFNAADEEQWEIIQETIDSSDYYVLILGQRYGSVIESGSDAGISYTEKEFRYAREKKIPILVFIIDDDVAIKPEFMEKDPESIKKLADFKTEAKKGRTVQWWTNIDELAREVSESLHQQMDRKKRPGWIRGDAFDIEASHAEILSLNKKIRELEQENAELKSQIVKRVPELMAAVVLDQQEDEEEDEKGLKTHGKLLIDSSDNAYKIQLYHNDVLVTVCCQGRNFTAKYKDVLQPGYTAKPVPFAEPEKDKYVPLPKKMEQGMVLPVVRAEKKQGFTSPPKVYTEDTLLSAMETAGNKEFEKDTEKKGLGTPATRAAILEKLVSSGYVERKGKQMIPTEDGVAAIRNIPDYLKSASMTAEWENDLLRMERGEIKPHDFMQGIHGLLDKMLADLRQIPTVAAAPYYNKVSVGSCPVCGNPVHESKLSFCCADRSCKFALWKESRYLSNMRKTLDKKMAVDLLKKGRTHVKDFYSTKKDKTFAADLVMRVEEGRAQYSLEFSKTPMKTKT